MIFCAAAFLVYLILIFTFQNFIPPFVSVIYFLHKQLEHLYHTKCDDPLNIDNGFLCMRASVKTDSRNRALISYSKSLNQDLLWSVTVIKDRPLFIFYFHSLHFLFSHVHTIENRVRTKNVSHNKNMQKLRSIFDCVGRPHCVQCLCHMHLKIYL